MRYEPIDRRFSCPIGEPGRPKKPRFAASGFSKNPVMGQSEIRHAP